MILFIAPEGRGVWGREMIKAAFSWMFQNTDAQRLIGVASHKTAEKIRLTYPPEGGIYQKINGSPRAAARWIYNRENWKG